MSLGQILYTATATAEDVDGGATLLVTEQPDELLGISVRLESGDVVGLALTRDDTQQIRHIITDWLVRLAPKVGSA